MSTLRQSAAVKLLQSPHAPLTLSFLYDQFKQKQHITIPHARLSEELTAYLDALDESHPGRYSSTAVNYLRAWCDDDHRLLAEARRVAELATEIKQLAVQLAADPPDDDAFLRIEGDPAVDMHLARPLWTPSATTTFAGVEPEAAALDLSSADFEALFTQFYVDESRLRRRVATLLERQPRITLGEVATAYPLTQGLAELVSYVALAATSPPSGCASTWTKSKGTPI
ncbi:MAG TPA: DUF3375 family protein [Candidatus Sulfomarinibacteraceae bacterium]|nr:DUF3375 family protein [Candidatus Sulfomarinibacteraceae bacterium]